jgi:hypothetical protein
MDDSLYQDYVGQCEVGYTVGLQDTSGSTPYQTLTSYIPPQAKSEPTLPVFEGLEAKSELQLELYSYLFRLNLIAYEGHRNCIRRYISQHYRNMTRRQLCGYKKEIGRQIRGYCATD